MRDIAEIRSDSNGESWMILNNVLPCHTMHCISDGCAFSSAVPAIWNNLPTSVTEANSLLVFRRRLKTHLFTVAFKNSG